MLADFVYVFSISAENSGTELYPLLLYSGKRIYIKLLKLFLREAAIFLRLIPGKVACFHNFIPGQGYKTFLEGPSSSLFVSLVDPSPPPPECKRIEINQSWYRYVPQAERGEWRTAKRHVVDFNECATLNKLQVTGLLIEINMLIIS